MIFQEFSFSQFVCRKSLPHHKFWFQVVKKLYRDNTANACPSFRIFYYCYPYCRILCITITEAYSSLPLYPQKIVKTFWVSNIFRRNRKKQLTWTGLHSTYFYSTWNKTIKPYPGNSCNTNSSDFQKIQLSIDSSL